MVYLYPCGQDASYADEHFAIYVGTTANLEDMVQVSDEYVATGEYLKYEADLTAYAGQTIYIAIRHFNVTDMFYLNIDKVVVKAHEGSAPVGMPGDVNLDGQLSFADVALLYQYILGQADLSDEAAANADVNLDGNVGMLDVAALYQIVLGS